MGVFDAAVITTDGINVVATVQREDGPLEAGYFDVLGVWQPFVGPSFVGASGFGLDSSNGQPYFDTAGPTLGEGADMYCDPVAETLWLGDAR